MNLFWLQTSLSQSWLCLINIHTPVCLAAVLCPPSCLSLRMRSFKPCGLWLTQLHHALQTLCFCQVGGLKSSDCNADVHTQCSHHRGWVTVLSSCSFTSSLPFPHHPSRWRLTFIFSLMNAAYSSRYSSCLTRSRSSRCRSVSSSFWISC